MRNRPRIWRGAFYVTLMARQLVFSCLFLCVASVQRAVLMAAWYQRSTDTRSRTGSRSGPVFLPGKWALDLTSLRVVCDACIINSDTRNLEGFG